MGSDTGSKWKKYPPNFDTPEFLFQMMVFVFEVNHDHSDSLYSLNTSLTISIFDRSPIFLGSDRLTGQVASPLRYKINAQTLP